MIFIFIKENYCNIYWNLSLEQIFDGNETRFTNILKLYLPEIYQCFYFEEEKNDMYTGEDIHFEIVA